MTAIITLLLSAACREAGQTTSSSSPANSLVAGRFCREGQPTNCWDLDLTAKTMTLVLPNGERALKDLPLKAGGDGFDYSVEALNGSQVQVKLIDPNTIGIRNSKNASPDFDRFVRR